MTKLDAFALCDLCHCLERAEAMIQILHELANSNGNHHQALMIEIIEEYLLRARKTLGDR